MSAQSPAAKKAAPKTRQELLNTAQAAHRINELGIPMSVRTLERRRQCKSRSNGPFPIIIAREDAKNGRVYYEASALDRWCHAVIRNETLGV